MSLFLLEYDRPAGELIRLTEFPDSERDRAYAERNRLELAKEPHIEVVVLEADSLETIKKTHRRYFYTLEELAHGA